MVGGAKAATGQDVYTGFQILQSTAPDFASPTKTVAQKFSSRPLRALAGLVRHLNGLCRQLHQVFETDVRRLPTRPVRLTVV